MEYLFKKDEMQRLLDGSPDGNTVVVSVNFKHGDAKGVFIGEILAMVRSIDPASGNKVNSDDPGTITGCPNPPGC